MLVDFETEYLLQQGWAETFDSISESKESEGNLTKDDVLDIITLRIKAALLSSGELL